MYGHIFIQLNGILRIIYLSWAIEMFMWIYFLLMFRCFNNFERFKLWYVFLQDYIHYTFVLSWLLDLQKHMCISILISTCMNKCSLPLARLYPSHSHKLPFHRDKLQDLDQLEEAGFFSVTSCFYFAVSECCEYVQYPSFLSGWITCEMATGREGCGEGCGRARNVWTSVGFQLRHFEIHNPSIWI